MQNLTEEDLKQIMARRDARYDGRFFFGVKTTKIYCRPVCPAKPKLSNILIFKSQAEAEREGYRPCLRCHPDAAPDARILDGTLNTVSRALKILENEPDLSLTRLAKKLGITDRHLRRLFDEHLGASPIEIITSKRLHLAYQLVTASRIHFSEIAFAVGFQSVRRFNEAFKKLYREPPLHFRRLKAPVSHAQSLTLTLPIVTPYDFSLVLAYLKRHEAYGIEKVSDHSYQRFVAQKKGYGKIELKQKGPSEIEVSLFNIPLTELRGLLRKLKNLFDLEHHPAHLPDHPILKAQGVRVPGSFDDFETIVSIVLSQLVSTEQAKAKLKQIIEKYGKELGQEGEQKIYAFPEPSVLASAELEALGMTRVKAQAIRDLARLAQTSLPLTREAYLNLKGFGPWTVEMIAMRCLRDPDPFPKNDLIIKRTLEALKLKDNDWAPHRAYLTHCLWRDYGAKKS